MSDFLDIATSLHTGSLTLFVGTGFSKYLTNNSAPNWRELIVECAIKIDPTEKLLNDIFILDISGNVIDEKYELTICAQILEIECQKKDFNLKEIVCEIIRSKINLKTIDEDKLEKLRDFFNLHQNINIVTTNFDTLFSEFVIPETSRIIIEGSTMSRVNNGHNIYHIHGCIAKPNSLILTLQDYYNFQNSNNYFSRKFYTLLQESTVAVLGYSLGDFNLNTILSEVQNSKRESFRKTSLYYVNKAEIPDVITKFYSHTYGIRVIKNKPINNFFTSLNSHYDKAKDLIDSVDNLRKVIEGRKKYRDDFLKLRISLPTILVQAASIGIESDNDKFLNLIVDILKRKREFTTEDNAWVQYEHLADWLIEVASTVIIKNSIIEKEFKELVKYSFKKCSRNNWKGFSWYAWREWNTRWHEMKIENQNLLQKLIQNNSWDPDLEITEIYK